MKWIFYVLRMYKYLVMVSEQIYHVCSKAEKIVFRTHEDYVLFINRLATIAYVTSTEIWAYCVMSTHFHVVVRTQNINAFVRLVRLHINRWRRKKYDDIIDFEISYKLLLGPYNIRNAITYVLRNPVHHNVADYAIAYPYSSICCYYGEMINFHEYTKVCCIQPLRCKFSELSTVKQRKIAGSRQLPDSYVIVGEQIIIPESFVQCQKVEQLYNNARSYLYNITATLKGETESVSLFGKLSDIALCEFIDKSIAPKKYCQLNQQEKDSLKFELRKMGVDTYQMNRAGL